MEPENDGLVQMIFLFNWVIFRFHVILPGCNIHFVLNQIYQGSLNGTHFGKMKGAENAWPFFVWDVHELCFDSGGIMTLDI